ncbi:MAG: ATP-dependent helicase [Phycisphaerae bacterium]|nr:ATP-dependent helicase [Phycisphaerae bacterium]
MPHWLDELNPAQRDAVTHGDGPLLIVAGAGTGKTKTLACRVAWLVEHGTPPERILLLTFTRRAAAEMITRAGHLTGAQTTGKVWGGTFHAVGNRLLRYYGRAMGLPSDFTVIDAADAADLMNLIRGELGLAKGDKRFPRKETLAAIYSRTVNAESKLAATLKGYFPWCAQYEEPIRQILQVYMQRKREQNVLDYDDLLLYWATLAESQELGDTVERRFDHILVDEYQDTNAVQSRILRNMRKTNHNICVVGDDAQSIYSFRAATVRNILDFSKQFPGTRIVTLEQNYRSTEPILAASNAVMARARERFTKNLWSQRPSHQKPLLITCMDEAEQSEEVCRNILAHHERGIPLHRQAVLFRAGYHSDMLEVELTRRHIPFHKYGGLKFVEAAHVKDMLSFLRILENPHDEISWFRVLQLLEGIGPRSARRIMDHLGVRGGGARARRAEPAGAHPAKRSESEGGHPARLSGVQGSGVRVQEGAAALPQEDSGQGAKKAGEAAAARGAELAASASPLRRLFETPPVVPAAAARQFEQLRRALADCCGFVLKHSRAKGPRARSASEGQADDGDPRSRVGLSSAGEPDDADPAPRPGELPPAVQVERIRRFYEPLFQKLYDNATIRLRDIEQLEQIAAGYRSRARFITDLTLDPPTSTSDLAGPPHLDEDYLVLSTIHSAKGCEWDVVHIIHAADGNIPSDMAIQDQDGVEEERRLFYVAMTRAKDMLYVYFPLRYYRARMGLGDTHHYAQLTRFLAEGPKSFFDQRGAAGFTREGAQAAKPIPSAQKVNDWVNKLLE